MSPTATYRPRHPERTPFYQCLEDYWDEFKESYPYFYEAEYGPWRPVVEKTVHRFLPPLLGVRPLAPWFCPSEMWPMFAPGALSVFLQNEIFLVHPVNGEVPPVKGRPWKLPHYANRGKTSSSGGELASARSCFSTVRTALGKL